MADIKRELNDIKTAIYGKDVRGSIHDGIDKINKESEGSRVIANDNKNRQDSLEQQFDDLQQNYSEGTPSTAEVVAARTNTDTSENYSTIGRRMDDEYKKVTSQLNDNMLYSESIVSNVSTRKKGKRPIVVFVADDAPKEDLDILKPLVEQYKVPIGIGVVPYWTEDHQDFMSWEELKTMESLGCEMLLHGGYKHLNLTQLTEEEMRSNLRGGYVKMLENGFNPKGFVYAFNAHDNKTQKVVGEFFDFAFSKTTSGARGRNFPLFNNQVIDRVALGSYFDGSSPGFPSDTTSLEYYKSRVDECKDKSNLLVFVLHSNVTNEIQAGYIEETIKYIISQDIDILSPSEAMKEYANIINIQSDLGDFIIGADGVGRGFSAVNKKMNYYTAMTKPSEYPSNTITNYYVNNDGANGFPGNRAGTITVNKVGNQLGYVSMIYSAYNSSDVFYRIGRNDDTWGEFIKIGAGSGKVVYPHNTFKISDNLSKYKFGDVSVNIITDTLALDGAPISRTARLETYNLYEGNNRNYQIIFYNFGEWEESYIRYHNGTSWGVFSPLKSHLNRTPQGSSMPNGVHGLMNLKSVSGQDDEFLVYARKADGTYGWAKVGLTFN